MFALKSPDNCVVLDSVIAPEPEKSPVTPISASDTL